MKDTRPRLTFGSDNPTDVSDWKSGGTGGVVGRRERGEGRMDDWIGGRLRSDKANGKDSSSLGPERDSWTLAMDGMPGLD